jgi:hypothetical protein
MRALESRADIESLEELQQQRRELIDSGAQLAALYGSFGLWDNIRKQRVELAKVASRARLTEHGDKVTEAAVEQYAYADDEYRAFLERAEKDKIAWVRLENRITEINERIRNRELSLRAYSVEAGLR